MAVNFSPYSKRPSESQPLPPTAESTDLADAIRRRLQKVAQDNTLTDPQKQVAINKIIADNKEQKTGGSVTGKIGNVLGMSFGPLYRQTMKHLIQPGINFGMAATELVNTGRNNMNEAATNLAIDVFKGPNAPDFVRNKRTATNRPKEGQSFEDKALSPHDRFYKHAFSRQAFNASTSPTSEMYAGDNLKGKAGGVLLEMAFDWTTYLTPGSSAIGKGSKLAMSAKFAPGTALAIKYPEMLLKQGNVARYGAIEVPKYIRDAENAIAITKGLPAPFQIGVKFMGKDLGIAGEGLSYAYRGLVAPLGKGVAEVASQSRLGRAITPAITRQSLRDAVQSGIFRNSAMNVANKDFVQAVGRKVSNEASRGKTVWMSEYFNKRIIAEFVPLWETAVGDATLSGAAHAIETGNLTGLSAPVRAMAEKAIQLMREGRQSVSPLAAKLRTQRGIDIQDMGWLDNYLSHNLTPESSAIVFANEADSILSKFTEFSQTAATQVRDGLGVTTFRKYVKDQKFMNEVLKEGTVREINGIWSKFLKSKGIPDHKFFEDDLLSIMNSYGQSIARTHGRIALVSTAARMGPDVLMPMIYKIVKDPALIKRLKTAVHSGRKLMVSVASAADRKAAQSGVNLARTKAQQALDDGRAIQGLVDEVDRMLAVGDDDFAYAATRTMEDQRGFNEWNLAEYNNLTKLRASLVDGTYPRYMELDAATKEYFALYPDANSDDLDNGVEWLNEKIQRAMNGGKADQTHEQIALGLQRQRLQDKIDALPSGADASAASDELDEINKLSEAFAPINKARELSPYADDGVLYGRATTEGPYRVWTTAPPTAANDAGAAYLKDPDAIMSHAIPEQNLVDPNTPEHMAAWADTPTLIQIDEILGEMGLVDDAFALVVDDAFRNGRINPRVVAEVEYESKTALIQFVLDYRANLGRGIDADEFFNGIKMGIHDIVASTDPSAAEAVTEEVMSRLFARVVATAKDDGFDGVMVPMSHLVPDSPKGKWGALTPNDATPLKIGDEYTDSIQRVMRADGKLNPLVDSIISNTTEKSQLDLITRRRELQQAGFDTNAADDAVKALQAELSNMPELEIRKPSEWVTVDGVSMPRDAVTARVQAGEDALDAAQRKLDADLAIEMGPRDAATSTQTIDAITRLRMSMGPDRTLQTWTPQVEQALIDEIGEYITLLQRIPAKGMTKIENAKWIADAEKLMAASSQMGDPAVGKAYYKLALLVTAEEARLRSVSAQLRQDTFELSYARAGLAGNRVADLTIKGWSEIKGMGVQMPDVVLRDWGNNISKLKNPSIADSFFKGLDKYTNYWKRYVTNSVGFVTRNAYSGYFMNFTAGASVEDMAEGLRWATAQNKTWLKGNKSAQAAAELNWMSEVGLTTPEQIAFGNDVMERVAATGRGISLDNPNRQAMRGNRIVGKTMDFMDPGQKLRVGDNPFVNFIGNANDTAERALRTPLALMSVRRGDSFEETVALISRIHIDYSDLSKLDIAAKRLIPFYMWSSRNVPLQMQQMLMRPKAYYEYERFAGEFPVGLDDPNTPEIEGMVLPKYARDSGPAQIGARMIFSPDLPYKKLESQVRQFLEPNKVVSQMTPFVKVPAEVWMLRRKSFTGAPFEQTEAAGYELAIAKLLDRLSAAGLVEYNKKTNELEMRSEIQYIIESNLPTLAHINRFSNGRTGGRNGENEKWVSSILGWFGVPVKISGDEQIAKELISRQFSQGRKQKADGAAAARRFNQQHPDEEKYQGIYAPNS